MGFLLLFLLAKFKMILNPLASESYKRRRRHCRVPTIDRGRDTALPSPLYHSGAAGIDVPD